LPWGRSFQDEKSLESSQRAEKSSQKRAETMRVGRRCDPGCRMTAVEEKVLGAIGQVEAGI
jgi:hypothetical protein